MTNKIKKTEEMEKNVSSFLRHEYHIKPNDKEFKKNLSRFPDPEIKKGTGSRIRDTVRKSVNISPMGH